MCRSVTLPGAHHGDENLDVSRYAVSRALLRYTCRVWEWVAIGFG